VIVAIHPPHCSEGIVDGLALAGVNHVEMADLVPESRALDEANVLLVELGDQPMRRLREVARIADEVGLPIVLVASRDQLAMMDGTPGVADFIISPADPIELRLRVQRLAVDNSDDAVLVFKDLVLNPLTYQATLATAPIDLTFMEYELLRFLVENPVRVWSREQLLSKVWGYDYYGGARTVDVHIRRLRSKLGEERASWITTVRSVGYRFG
jgi:DNA-binding response OmpR family regulator